MSRQVFVSVEFGGDLGGCAQLLAWAFLVVVAVLVVGTAAAVRMGWA